MEGCEGFVEILKPRDPLSSMRQEDDDDILAYWFENDKLQAKYEETNNGGS